MLDRLWVGFRLRLLRALRGERRLSVDASNSLSLSVSVVDVLSALCLPAMLSADRIAALLQPFVPDVSPGLAEQLQKYLDLLLRWNARTNLTAIRDPEQIVARHFGESLFAAHVLRDSGAFASSANTLADLGSGAGFPGIPIHLVSPDVGLTLIESHNKKATFLREVSRALKLDSVKVFHGRAQDWPRQAGIVTLRAVEKFDQVLPVAASLVAPGGRLCLLIGSAQLAASARLLGPTWQFSSACEVPQSNGRIVILADRNGESNE